MPHICPHCGTANDSKATFCGACATQIRSTSTALVPLRKKGALPLLSQSEKATLGSLALGLAAVALRLGTQLLKHVAEEQKPSHPAPLPDAPTGGAVRIRRRWVVGDRYGPLRWGEEEIEIDEPRDTGGPLRITLK